jgi:hypothetical protein
MDADRKIGRTIRWNKQDPPQTLTAAGADIESPPTGAENMVAGVGGSELSVLKWMF